MTSEEMVNKIHNMGFKIKFYDETDNYFQMNISSDCSGCGDKRSMSKTYICNISKEDNNMWDCSEMVWWGNFGKSFYTKTKEEAKTKVMEVWLRGNYNYDKK